MSYSFEGRSQIEDEETIASNNDIDHCKMCKPNVRKRK